MSLPDDTDRVVLLYASISARITEDWEPPAGVDTEQQIYSDSEIATFEAGDELPLPLARRCWSGFSDKLAAYDADGNRLDTPSRTEKQEFSTALYSF